MDVLVDEDQDGVDDLTEDAGPNGGDGNQAGTPDMAAGSTSVSG